MARARSKNESMRARLVDACRTLSESLKETLEPQMCCPDGVAVYQERWQRLDAVLAEFQREPANFDSGTGVGLAELIHRVEPTTMLIGTDRSFFILRPEGYAEGSFGPHDLARTLEEAYRREGFGAAPIAGFDEVLGAYYDQTTPDLICSELNNFFNGLSKVLRRREDDQALALARKDFDRVKETPDEKEVEKRERIIKRAINRDPFIFENFAWRCCTYCFRMIPERKQTTKTTIGKTCSLHDPKNTIFNVYQPAQARHTRLTKEHLEKPSRACSSAGSHTVGDETYQVDSRGANEHATPHSDSTVGFSECPEDIREKEKNERIIDVASIAMDPEFVPMRLRAMMQLALLEHRWHHSDPIFTLTKEIFLSEPEKTVELILIKQLQGMVSQRFPRISMPDVFINSIQQLVSKNEHTPKNLNKTFRSFLNVNKLPFHPDIIALYMVFFLEESWFAEEHDRNYYGSDRERGRPRKIDHTDLINSALSLQENDSIKKAQAMKMLAAQFGYSTARVRQILREHQIAWKRI